MPHDQCPYGTLPNGETATLFSLQRGDLSATLTDYGARLVSLMTPDRDGQTADITLGFDSLEGWLTDPAYMGATCGRMANRIPGGKLVVGGETYQLACNNDDVNHLHGGEVGFDKHRWTGEAFESDRAVGVRFTRVSPDGEEGYPGALDMTVTYALTDDGELIIDFTATTDKLTVVSLVNHTYWNLAGHDAGTICDHELTIHADRYLPIDEHHVPLGPIMPVENTPWDFRTAKPIGRDLAATGGEPCGYDNNFCINGYQADRPIVRRTAEVYDPASGRRMLLATDQPGVQLYSGNFLDGSFAGKGGATYPQYAGFCLETQRYPNALNNPEYPPVTLAPGNTYSHRMVHTFGVR
jgi:aldose 1-epimerase